MTSPFKAEVVLDGTISSSRARQKWDNAVESGARRIKIKGKPLFLHSIKNDKYILRYYQNYGGDFCDAMFTGEIFEYDDGGSQILGSVAVPPAMKRFSWLLLAVSIPLALLFCAVLTIASPDYFEKLTALIITFSGTVLVIATISFMCMVVDKRKVKIIMEYLHEFLKEEDL